MDEFHGQLWPRVMIRIALGLARLTSLFLPLVNP
jgi:hypothetical protein